MSRELPAKPNLEHLKKQAKDLLHQPSTPAGLQLSDAQHLIARDYGFASWAKLKEHVESVTRLWEPAVAFAAAVRASDGVRAAQVLQAHPELRPHLNEPMANYGAGMQPLLAAVQRGDRKTIDVLLHAGADIHARSRWWAGGIGVLDECAPDFASFLMERGAQPDAHAAARLGMFDRLQALVTADPATVHARGAHGQTPLHCASTLEIARYLLAAGADIDARDLQHESTPAQHMLRVVQARHYRHDRQPIARYLAAEGCQTDLLMAAALGDLPLVRLHLDRDPGYIRMRASDTWFPKQDARSAGIIYIEMFGRDRTPHQIARDFGHEEVFRYLMEHSPEDVTLAQAFELGDEATFRAFLASRPNLVETLSDEERRRLPDAAQNNNAAAVRLMLQTGWPVDAKGEYGLTPLSWAAWHGNAELVRDILRYHPQLEKKDCHHQIAALRSALHGSENSWHRDTGDYVATVAALLDAGAQSPELSDDLECSEPVREFLKRRLDGD